MSNKIKIAIIGAGSRGYDCFAKYIKNDFNDAAEITAVAEPDKSRRERISSQHHIPSENVFNDWQNLLDNPKLADAVLIATQDQMHTRPAVAACKKGYHILLEKPMATTEKECEKIIKAVEENAIIFAVCHVLRYAPYYKKIKEVIDSGKIGEVCIIDHHEGVGWWHHVHSYVRGNWRRTKDSAPMLLAKACHDIDLISWWMDRKCTKVSSFGSLKYFKESNAPKEAATRCMNCVLADNKCPYSAKKFYFDKLQNAEFDWPLNVLVDDFTPQALEKALIEGPYGRCVYYCDNDVVDHQVVSMEFEDLSTAAFTMSAFTPHGRKTSIQGTHGYLEGDEKKLELLDFNSGLWKKVEIDYVGTDLASGHGGGDQQLLREFINAIRNNDVSQLTTNPHHTLMSHLIVFAAEKSRHSNRIIML